MANNAWRNPTNPVVAQVWKGSVTTTTNGHTYILTLTAGNGDTAVVTYTVVNPPDTTVTLVAAGLVAAWNASTNPMVAAITATQNAGQIILTADTAGVPFSVGASGTGTWSGTGNTTANVGNNDYGTARNWQLDAVPASTNDVLVDGPQSVSLLYSLNQSSVAIADFRVFPGFNGQIGRFENSVPHYLRIDPDLFRYEGSGQLALIDIGSAAISAYINSSGTPTAGRNGIYLLGSAITTLEIVRGNLGLAALDGETATVTTIKVGYVNNQQGDVNFTIGSGVTLTTLDQGGGIGVLRCAATTVTNGVNSQLRTEGSGAITTINAYGTCEPNSTGTITNLNVYGTVDFSKSKIARTVTNCTLYPGARLIRGPWMTFTNGIVGPSTGAGQATVEYRQ